MKCRECIEQLYPYLDRELSDEEAESVRKHLEECPPCAEHFLFEQGVLRRISDICRSTTAPLSLKEKVASLCNKSTVQ